ncbi:MAG: FkbM family methyltransferase [Lachnospiraceae bacterium]|nr:FkbM family methyltransferase [Lachnospiraceae bacterium]
MMKLLIFGTGDMARKALRGMDNISQYADIVGFVDNDDTKYGKVFYDRKIYHPGQIKTVDYDKICILLEQFQEVYYQLVDGYHIAPEKIINKEELLKYLMIEKYKNSMDADIRDTLKYWEDNPLSFFNQHKAEDAARDRVFWDEECNMPYIIFKGKRLYYPRGYSDFIYEEGCIYAMGDRGGEQAERSPHRYLTNEINFTKGDVVVDAGAMEGDFALAHIEDIGKLYIFECDPQWIKALKMTYKDYMDKVVIIPKMLGDRVNERMTTLIEAIPDGRVDFIKMDIEGAEVSALLSAEALLQNNNVKCTICTYHKKDDAVRLEKIFHENGYQTSFSNGYMIFHIDKDIFSTLDFRKGVIYAKK